MSETKEDVKPDEAKAKPETAEERKEREAQAKERAEAEEKARKQNEADLATFFSFHRGEMLARDERGSLDLYAAHEAWKADQEAKEKDDDKDKKTN